MRSLIFSIFIVFPVLALVPSCSDSPTRPSGDDTRHDWRVLSTGHRFDTIWAFAKDDVRATAGPFLFRYDGAAWRMEQPPGALQAQFGDAWFANDDVGFLVGIRGRIVRYRFGAYETVPSGTEQHLNAVWGAGLDAVYAVGAAGEVVHYDGGKWRRQSTPFEPDTAPMLLDVWGSRVDDVFAVGLGGTILHFDGDEWRKMESGTDVTLRGVWGIASDDVYAVGSRGTLLHYDGDTWKPVELRVFFDLHAIGGTARTNIIVTGAGITLRFNGSEWRSELTDATITTLYSDPRYGVLGGGREGRVEWFDEVSSTVLLQGAWGDGSGSWANDRSLFIAAGYNARRYENGEWTEYRNLLPGIVTDVWGTASDDVFACGTSQFVMHFDGTQWGPLDTGTNQPIFRSMWGTSSSNLFVAGSERIPRLAGVMLRYDGSGFTRMEFFEQPYWGVWGTSENDAVAVGDRGLIAHYDGAKWTRMESGTTDDLICVWGDAPDRYFAGSQRGQVYAYDGESWSPAELKVRAPIYSLWGSSGRVYASAIHDVYLLEGSRWLPLNLPSRHSYLTTAGHPDVGLYVTGRSGLVLFSSQAP